MVKTAIVRAGLAVCVSLVVVLGASASASAARVGDLCRIAQYGYPGFVFNRASGDLMYELVFGDYVRIDGYVDDQFYLAHGTNKPTGLMYRLAVEQSTCR